MTIWILIIEASFRQLKKNPSPIFVALSGMLIKVELKQLKKKVSPIDVTQIGIVIEANFAQLRKHSSIDVTLFGTMIDVKLRQSLKLHFYK